MTTARPHVQNCRIRRKQKIGSGSQRRPNKITELQSSRFLPRSLPFYTVNRKSKVPPPLCVKEDIPWRKSRGESFVQSSRIQLSISSPAASSGVFPLYPQITERLSPAGIICNPFSQSAAFLQALALPLF